MQNVDAVPPAPHALDLRNRITGIGGIHDFHQHRRRMRGQLIDEGIQRRPVGPEQTDVIARGRESASHRVADVQTRPDHHNHRLPHDRRLSEPTKIERNQFTY